MLVLVSLVRRGVWMVVVVVGGGMVVIATTIVVVVGLVRPGGFIARVEYHGYGRPCSSRQLDRAGIDVRPGRQSFGPPYVRIARLAPTYP